MRNQGSFRIEPLCTLYTVVSTKPGKVFGCLCLLVLREVPWRDEIGLDLIEVPGVNIIRAVSATGRIGKPYLVFRLVFVSVRLFVTPIVMSYVRMAKRPPSLTFTD